MPIALLVVVVMFAALVLWFAARLRRRARWLSPEQQLIRMMGAVGADRLIKYEQDRNPHLSRREAARRALDRAEYDRGR
jgi:hypothetical protein